MYNYMFEVRPLGFLALATEAEAVGRLGLAGYLRKRFSDGKYLHRRREVVSLGASEVEDLFEDFDEREGKTYFSQSGVAAVYARRDYSDGQDFR